MTLPQPVVDGDANTNMVVDGTPATTSRSRSSGFDPSLLNPLSPSEEAGSFFMQSSTPSVLLNGVHSPTSLPSHATPPERSAAARRCTTRLFQVRSETLSPSLDLTTLHSFGQPIRYIVITGQ